MLSLDLEPFVRKALPSVCTLVAFLWAVLGNPSGSEGPAADRLLGLYEHVCLERTNASLNASPKPSPPSFSFRYCGSSPRKWSAGFWL